MKSTEFVKKALNIANDYKTIYAMGGFGWPLNDNNKKRLAEKPSNSSRKNAIYNASSDTFAFDCVCMLKAIFWGWCGNLNATYGGAIYKSNGIPDVGADSMFNNYCHDKSSDFTKIEVGEFVWMEGHIGVYVGNRQVVEATSAWNSKVVISDLGNNGERSYKGKRVYTWSYHAKSNFIEYVPMEVPRKYEAGQTLLLNGYTHKSKDASESIGEYYNYPAEIIKIEKYECEYPYELRNLGWCREKYLSDYVPPKEEKPIEPSQEESKEKELSIWQKIIQAIIDILKAFLGKED